MSLETIVIAAALAALGLVVLAVILRDRRRGSRTASATTGPGALKGARDVVDQSIGMYLLRRLTGRSTNPSAEPLPAEPDLAAASAPSGDERAQRAASVPAAVSLPEAAPLPAAGRPGIGEGAAPASASRAVVTFYEPRSSTPPIAVAESVAPRVPTPVASSRKAPAPAVAAVTTAPPRERLVRDTGIALVGLTVLGLALATLWPHGSNGRPASGDPGIVRASATNVPNTTFADAASASAPRTSPSGVVLSETGRPSRPPTGSPVVTPPATRATATPRSTKRPTSTPPGATPSPVASPSGTASPSPGPTATPEPTPPPTPEPTPEPTPSPTPEPTPS